MKKFLALVLALVLAVSLFTGCQPKTVTTDVGTMTRDEIKAFEEASGGIKLPITTNGETIVFMTESSNTGMTDSVVIKELSRRTGAKVEVLELPAASMSEKAKVLIAAKENMPDVVAAGITAEQLDDLGMQGAFEPINDHINELPNFKKLFIDEAKERRTEKVMKSWKAPDGNLYRFPSYGINRDVNHGMLYRKDIFDKHGLTMWDSPETFYQTLKKLKELYPDSTPLVSKTGSTFFNNILASWGIQGWPGAYFDYEESVWKSSAIDPTYREFLNYIKKLYDEKLLDPEFLTSTQPAWTNKMTQKDKAFVTYDWIGRLDMFKEQTASTIPEYDLRYGNPIGPTQKVIALSSVTGGMAVKKGANSLIALKINDYLLSDGGAELMTCGIEGVTFNWNEDKTRAKYIGFEEGKAIGIKDLEEKYGMCLSGVTRRYDKRSCYFNYTEREQEAQDLMNNKAGGGYLLENPELTFTSEEKEVISKYEPTLRKIAEEYAYAFILTGKSSDSDWNQYVTKMNNNGLEEVIKAYNSANSRYGK